MICLIKWLHGEHGGLVEALQTLNREAQGPTPTWDVKPQYKQTSLRGTKTSKCHFKPDNGFSDNHNVE